MGHDNATKRAASSTDPECPVKKQRSTPEVGALPLAIGYEVQKTYYKHLVEKWQGQQDVSVSALLQLPQPSEAQLGRISYHAKLRLDGTVSKTPRWWLKRPQLNSYSNRFCYRWGSDRFLFVNIPQRFPDFHGSQLGRFDFLDRSFRFLVPKLKYSEEEGNPFPHYFWSRRPDMIGRMSAICSQGATTIGDQGTWTIGWGSFSWRVVMGLHVAIKTNSTLAVAQASLRLCCAAETAQQFAMDSAAMQQVRCETALMDVKG